MAIFNRNGSYQAKLRDSNGKWLSRTFRSHRQAEEFEAKTKVQMNAGHLVTNEASQITFDLFFPEWLEIVSGQASEGWRVGQKQLYRDYVAPFLGAKRLQAITPTMIAQALNHMKVVKRSPQTQLHVYGLIRKVLKDAIELFQILTFNPALRTLRPKVPTKEARHLTVEEAKLLLQHVRGKEYGVAVWIQLYLGLRVGELQALTWDDVDLKDAILRIHRTYIRHEKRMQNYPKGRKQHSHRIPSELLSMLREESKRTQSQFIVTAIEGGMLSYEWYHRRLRRYCKDLGLPIIGTHGLRHSTSELYMSHGATADDLRRLFAHSSMRVTDRYLHDRGSRLERVSESLLLFPSTSELKCSQNVPKNEKSESGSHPGSL